MMDAQPTFEDLTRRFHNAKWINAEDMPSMPRGWYWAQFPGAWEWYNPEHNQTIGIDHARATDLASTKYWGPFSLDCEKNWHSSGRDGNAVTA
jgi:hypothetical protein